MYIVVCDLDGPQYYNISLWCQKLDDIWNSLINFRAYKHEKLCAAHTCTTSAFRIGFVVPLSITCRMCCDVSQFCVPLQLVTRFDLYHWKIKYLITTFFPYKLLLEFNRWCAITSVMKNKYFYTTCISVVPFICYMCTWLWKSRMDNILTLRELVCTMFYCKPESWMYFWYILLLSWWMYDES